VLWAEGEKRARTRETPLEEAVARGGRNQKSLRGASAKKVCPSDPIDRRVYRRGGKERWSPKILGLMERKGGTSVHLEERDNVA